MSKTAVNRSHHWLNLPESNVAIFSLLLNFGWEVQQMRFFQLPSELSCLDRVENCTLATVGDIGISLIAFWSVAAVSKSRRWILQPSWRQSGIFILVGIIITASFEALATGVLNLWQYADLMPTLPFLGTGLLPLLQWILIPLLIVWFVGRQLSHLRHKQMHQ